MKILIARINRESEKETLGKLYVYDDKKIKTLFECATLELAYKNNQRNISCIPTGEYDMHHRFSPAHGDHLILLGVDGRSYILLHRGNFHWNTQGCILVGKNHVDINRDGELDISASKQTFANLMAVLKDETEMKVTIVNV